MPTSLYLPAEEDTKVVITVGGKDRQEFDIFELESMFVEAQAKADDMGTDWKEEFPNIYKKRTKSTINPTQSALLWEGICNKIVELKKSLLVESPASSKQESPSPRKRKKKSG